MISYQILRDLDLNKKEATIYIACLSAHSLSISKLAKETQIQRTHLYDLTKKLVKKGFLVQSIKNNKKVFNAVKPKDLYEVQKQRLKKFKDNIVELEKLREKSNQTPKVIYYEGKEELDTMVEQSFLKKGEILVFDSDYFYEKEKGEYQKRHIEKRIKNQTFCRVITGITNSAITSKNRDPKEFRETRLLPSNLYNSETSIGIYKDKIFVINYFENYGYTIIDPNLVKTLKQIFEIIWESPDIIDK
jgi:sugar-specific transcriptional regulator TrmB